MPVVVGSSDLATLADVKAALNIPTSDVSHDTELQDYISEVTPVIEAITGPIVATTYTEVHDGGTDFIVTRHRPIISVTSVTEYRANTPYTLTQIASPDLGTQYSYEFEPAGRITRRIAGGGTQPFAGGLQTVVVVYTAGFTVIPANVTRAALDLIRINYQQTQQGTSRPALGSSYGGGTDDIEAGSMILGFYVPGRVRESLAPNRRHPSIA